MMRILRYIFNIKVLLGALVFGLGVFAVAIWLLWSARSQDLPQVPATAILKIIAAPTQTPLGIFATPTPTLEPTSAQVLATPTGDTNITTGKYVQVTGTGGDGLRLHNTPGISTKVNYVAIDAEVFVVKDGPVDADGYVWWELEDPYTNNAVGWGVANYLKVVQNP
jgi:hypothetical protein